MYLTDLTRNSFESGISATKWLALCKLLIAKKTPIQLESEGQVAINLSNSVLVLYRSYPADPGLQDYLKAAIQDGLLPTSTFVATLLQAAHSTDLHIPATLDTLCRIALDAHYSSGKPPIGSVVPLNNSPMETVNTLQDALALLRTAFSLPISHFHQLTTSVSELVMLLTSCISDLSNVSTTQAVHLFAEGNAVLANYRLSPGLRQCLDGLVLSLSLLIDDDVKIAREAQLLHTTQLAMVKGDVLGPSSETDMITLGLLLNHIITNRAHEYGAGDSKNAVALFIANFRWSSWTPTVFYTQLLLSAFTCLSQSGSSSSLWKSFVVGRLPMLLSSFTEIVKAESNPNTELSGALLAGLTALFLRSDIIAPGSQSLPNDTTSDTPEDNSRSFSREFLQQLIKYNLLTPQHAAQLDPMVSNELPPKWHVEAHDLGLDLAAYLETKLLQDNGSDNETQIWIDRIVKDAGSHSIFSSHILKRFATLGTSLDVDALGQICKTLHTNENLLDIIALQEPIADLIFYSAVLLEDYDCETVGDPQTAVSHLGNIVLFIQYTTTRFKLERRVMTKNGRMISLAYLIDTDWIVRLSDRTPDDIKALTSWYNHLFSKDSEGIEDNMLRSTKPKSLLQIAPALFPHVWTAWQTKKLEIEVILNGISYFNGPLLNWTLVGTIKFLSKEIQLRQFVAPLHYEIIQALILSPTCPKCVLIICAPYVMALLSDKKRQLPAPPSFNVTNLRKTLVDAMGLTGGAESLINNFSPGPFWYSQVQQALKKAFSMARSHKIAFLDIRRCLKTVLPIKFLQLMWAELVAAASQGELEACHRIATFVLATPQDATIPPLLPIFLHVVLPSLISSADMQQPPEQTITVELMVAIISSVLNAAMQLEFSLRTVSGAAEDRLVLGESSAAMARRLATDLRRSRNSHVSSVIIQRLSSSQVFVGKFPAFISEGT